MLQEVELLVGGSGPEVLPVVAQVLLFLPDALQQFLGRLPVGFPLADLQAARARGKMGGRSKTLSLEQQKGLKQMYKDQSVSVKEICQMMSISKPTLYKYLKGGHKTA